MQINQKKFKERMRSLNFFLRFSMLWYLLFLVLNCEFLNQFVLHVTGNKFVG